MLLGKYINKYYLKYAHWLLLGVIALVAVDYFQTIIPEALGQLVDLFDGVDSVSNIDMAALGEIFAAVLTVAVVMFLGRITWRLSIFNASKKIESGLRHQMFLKSERLSPRYYQETKIGTVMSWFTGDLETIEEFMGWGTIMLVDAFFLSVLVLVKMLLLDWVLALVLALPLVLIVVWGALVEKFMAMKWDERQKQFDRLYDFSRESFTGIHVVKAFVKETQQLHAFAKIARKNQDTSLECVKLHVLFDIIISGIIGCIMALILGLGGYFVYCTVSGAPFMLFGHAVKLSAGQLITFLGYFDTMVWPMMAMGQIVSMRSRAKASLKRVSDFLDTEEELTDCADAEELKDVKGEISFRNFTFTYPKSTIPALTNIDLTIEAGETVGIVGKIGCGKTTLVNSLLRLYNVGEGQVFIDGKDIMHCTMDSVRQAIAYVPQDNFLFNDTVRNNIAFSRQEATDEEVAEAAEFATVRQDIENFKDGYETLSGERGITLSGGQKQRISIARAYLKDAPVLVLDDSVSAVDVKTEESILNHIVNDRAGKTTIVIASRVSTVTRLKKILVLNEGAVEAFGTPEELAVISPTYQNMVYLQALEKEVEGGDC